MNEYTLVEVLNELNECEFDYYCEHARINGIICTKSNLDEHESYSFINIYKNECVAYLDKSWIFKKEETDHEIKFRSQTPNTYISISHKKAAR